MLTEGMLDRIKSRTARYLLHKVLSTGTQTVTRKNVDNKETFSIDGITVTVKDTDGYWKILKGGSTALGQTYVENQWDTSDLVSFLMWCTDRNRPYRDFLDNLARPFIPIVDFFLKYNAPSSEKDRHNISAHYDLSNEVFSLILDESMTYSSANFSQSDDSLVDGSNAKLDNMLGLLGLETSSDLLEIGTGWGSFAICAGKAGHKVKSATISEEQFKYASEQIENFGLSDSVEILFSHYRDIGGKFNGVVAIEMIEAVDWRLYDDFFSNVQRVLKPNSRLAMQAIVLSDKRFPRAKHLQDFIKSEVFPGGCLPSVEALERSANKYKLNLVTRIERTSDYIKTLSIWRENLNLNSSRLSAIGFDERAQRLFDFYFAYCIAGFSNEDVQLVQLVFEN